MPLMEGGSVAVSWIAFSVSKACSILLSGICLLVQDATQLVYPGGIKDDALVASILSGVAHVRSRQHLLLPIRSVVRLLLGMQALSYLHADGKIHKDIKADNILLSAEGQDKTRLSPGDFNVVVALSRRCVVGRFWCHRGQRLVQRGSGRGRERGDFSGSLALAHLELEFAEKEADVCWKSLLDGSRSHLCLDPASGTLWRLLRASHKKTHGVLLRASLSQLCSEKVDIWSFGITALEIAFGRPPYVDSDPIAMRKHGKTCSLCVSPWMGQNKPVFISSSPLQ
jgi:serine/threonine protein kinase